MNQAASTLSFGNHIHPEEVTPELRMRIVQNIGIDHLVWSGFLALMTVFLLVGTAFVDTVEKVSPALSWHLGTVIALGLWAELICYFIYDNRKKFVRNARVTTAAVVHRNDLEDFSTGVPRVRVQYIPAHPNPVDIDLLRRPDASIMAWAELDGLSEQFEHNLHAGDLVTILYEPDRPSRIRIVEFEH